MNSSKTLNVDFSTVSNLIGVTEDDIEHYIKEAKEKARLKLKQKEAVDRFKETVTGQIKVKDLKHLLRVKLDVQMHRRISTKADILAATEN